ncbi:MAG: hypothetical protein JNJ88_09960 [Planctomycetes bacterium]|nr:hypothetical protein [Planctomycetota bacterium]
MIRAVAAVAAAALLSAAAGAQSSRPKETLPTAQDMRVGLERGLQFLLKDQNSDGSWGSHRNMESTFWSNPESHRSWRVATTGLVVMTLLDAMQLPEAAGAVDRGLDYIVANCDLKRPSDWDTDDVWGELYGLQAIARALQSPRYKTGERRAKLEGAAKIFLATLERRQSPNGGWGYYADAEDAWRSQWATSFTSAGVVLAMLDSKAAGLPVNEKVLAGAVKAVKRCRLPNGAYSYDVMAIPAPSAGEGINNVKGSLGRIQVCNLALFRVGEVVTAKDLVEGLDKFFEHHKFLDVARMRPIPHEAYYYNAGYFYFYGHYYAAGVLEAIPAEHRARFVPQLARDVLKTQEADGSMWDFTMQSYSRPYATAFSMMTLQRILALTSG